MRRLVLLLATGVVLVLVVGLLVRINQTDSEATTVLTGTDCIARRYIVLEAQSVPSAQLIPCVSEDLDGWALAEETYSNDGSTVGWRTSSSTTDDGAGAGWSVSLTASCTPPAGATVEPNPEFPGVQVHSLDSNDGTIAVHQQWYQFTGGCVSSRIAIPDRFDEQRIFDELDASFDLVPRSTVNDVVYAESDGNFGLDPTPTPTP